MKKIPSSFLPAALAGVASFLTAGLASADNVFVSNNGNNTIEEISNGVVSTFADTDLDGVTGLAIYGNNLYAANNATPGAGYVAEFSLNGTFEGMVVGGLYDPRGITFDSEGNLYVANQSSGQLIEVPTGGFPSAVASGLNYPNGITFDNSGNLFVASGQGNLIEKISTSGGSVVSSTPFITDLNNPVGITYDSVGANAGNLFVVNNENTVLEFNATTGAPVSLTPFITDLNASDHLDDITVDSAGDFYVTDNGDNSVTKYDASGSILNVYSAAGDFNGPCYVVTETSSLVAPEPSTFVLMLGGLGLLSFVLRRRKLSPIKL